MAHDIYLNNGAAAMMYFGDEPWHGLGTELKSPATAQEAIQAAQLDYNVVKKPLFAHGIEEDARTCETDSYAVVPDDRWGSDDCPIFGIVSAGYTPLQNRQAFEFFDPIVCEGAAVYHTAGALGKGERIWILAKLPDHIQVVGEDIVDKFLLLSNSHDGESSVQIKFTPIRVVCQNTLSMALNEGPTLRVKHTSRLQARLNDTREMLNLINTRYDEIEEAFKSLVEIEMDDEKLDEYLKQVFPDPVDPDNARALDWAYKNRVWSKHFYAEGRGNELKGVRGTLWAAYNGVTELVDHRQIIGGNERRLQSIWFGSGHHTKVRAFEVALKSADWISRN